MLFYTRILPSYPNLSPTTTINNTCTEETKAVPPTGGERTATPRAQTMCPLRVLLVFLSATVAGYFVWKAVRSPPLSDSVDSSPIRTPTADPANKRPLGIGKVVGAGFWVFLDMASGRYLWRTIKER